MFRTLDKMHTMLDRPPETLKEVSFLQMYGRDLQEAQRWCELYKVKKNSKADLIVSCLDTDIKNRKNFKLYYTVCVFLFILAKWTLNSTDDVIIFSNLYDNKLLVQDFFNGRTMVLPQESPHGLESCHFHLRYRQKVVFAHHIVQSDFIL